MLNWFGAKSQFGVRLSHIKPTGNYGYIFKPTMGFELYYNEFFGDDSKFRFGFSLGYFRLKARCDTFPSYGIKQDGNYTYSAKAY
jgi:hypothetical protein